MSLAAVIDRSAMESGRIFFDASASRGNNMLFLGNTELAFRGHSLSISLSVDFFLILLGFLLPFFWIENLKLNMVWSICCSYGLVS